MVYWYTGNILQNTKEFIYFSLLHCLLTGKSPAILYLSTLFIYLDLFDMFKSPVCSWHGCQTACQNYWSQS